MATGRKRNVEIDLIVDDKQKSKLKGIGDEAGKTGGRFTQMSGGLKAAALGVAGLVGTKIISVLGDMTQAALEDNAAQVQLAVALKNTVGATDAQIASTEDWITETTRATGIVDNELRPALANLVRATGDLEVAQDQMGVAMDIATAKGLPLAAVTTAMGKAAGGNVGAMGRLGLKVRDAAGDFLAYDEILTEANRTMGGATAAAADSAEGAFRRLAVSADEAKESLGNVLLPVLADAAESANDLAVIAGFLADKLAGVQEGAAGAAAEEEGLFGMFTRLFAPADALVKTIGWLSDRIRDSGDAASEVENPYQGLIDHTSEIAATTDDATAALQDFEDEVRSQIDPIFNLISKINDLDVAQQNSATARDKYGEGSPEHREALRKEAESWLSVKDAQIKAANEAGLTRDAFRKVLEDMQIFTHEDIELILEDFDRVNDYEFRDKTIRTRVVRGDDTRNIARAAGGPVRAGSSYLVGEAGPEVVTMGSQGSVTPNHRLRSGGGSETIIIQVDGREIARAVRNHDRSLLPG